MTEHNRKSIRVGLRLLGFQWLVIALIWAIGCTTMSERYRITEPNGTEIEYRSRIMALGNGPAEFISAGDGTTAFTTEGKGISDNATEGLGKITEGAVRGLQPAPISFPVPPDFTPSEDQWVIQWE